MLKVKVIAVGKCKEEWLATALSEYEKRLSSRLQLLWVFPKDDAQLETMLDQEPGFIALDPKGELLDSIAFSKKMIRMFEEKGSRLIFALGGPEGFSDRLLRKSFWRFSLSPMTFTHQLARLILVEQIYRAFEIERGSPYHK